MADELKEKQPKQNNRPEKDPPKDTPETYSGEEERPPDVVIEN